MRRTIMNMTSYLTITDGYRWLQISECMLYNPPLSYTTIKVL